MEKKIIIRNEQPSDYQWVEELTRAAFYNLYVPGCAEHYLVHIMRGHQDFLPELDFVIEVDGKVVGNVMYTKATLTDEAGEQKQILTFGPLAVLPEYQRMGYGKQLLEHSFVKAVEMGYDVIVIFGAPSNYVSHGFKSCYQYNVCVEDGSCPAAMMVKELREGALDKRRRFYRDSPVMQLDEAAAARFDDALPKLKKEYRPSQEEFYILSHAVVRQD